MKKISLYVVAAIASVLIAPMLTAFESGKPIPVEKYGQIGAGGAS